MQTGGLEAGGSVARGVAPALSSITPTALESGQSTVVRGGGFPAMLGALNSQALTQVKQTAQMAERRVALPPATASNTQTGAQGGKQDVVTRATFADGHGEPPGSVTLYEQREVAPGQRSSGVLLPLNEDAMTAAGNIAPSSSHASHKDLQPDGLAGSIAKGRQSDVMPLAAPPVTTGEPSAAIVPVVQVPTPVVTTPADPAIHPASPRVMGLTETSVGRRGPIGSAAIARGNTAGRNLQAGATVTSGMAAAVQSDAGPQSPRATALPLTAPHLRGPIEAPASLGEQPGVRLPDRRVQAPASALNREDMAPAIAPTSLPAGTSVSKAAEPAHEAKENVTEIVAKPLAGDAGSMHTLAASPSHSTGAVIGANVHNTFLSSSSGMPVADRNPFQRLDSLSADPSLHLRSRSNMIEAGIESASYGWIEVRATSSAGLVSASIHGMDAAASVIQSQLHGLSSFLAEQAIPMREVTIGTGLGDDNAERRGGHQGNSEDREAGPGNTRAPTRSAITSTADVTPSSVISLHA